MALPALLGLALSVAPDIIDLFDGDEDNASGTVRSIAKAIPGVSGETDDELAAALQANPEVLFQFERDVMAHKAEIHKSETERLAAINQQMGREIQSGDAYVRRMRPTFGYIMALSWGGTMGAIIYSIVATPTEAPAVITAVSQLGMIWSVGLSVLGIYVYKRSAEKMGDTAPISRVVDKMRSALLAR